VPAKEGHRILGTLFSSTLFPGRAPEGKVLLTTFVGGRQPEIANLPDEALLAVVREELAGMLGVRAAPVFTRITRWPKAIPKYGADFATHLELMERFEGAHRGMYVGGHIRDGISLPDCINAGRKAAARILDENPAA